ncbi:hypothetical protein K435DRAFT_823206 [Dendrothele bispora CBS 962.96]|uniref:Helicase ATP-binding domain-containing protein n=1 Tax=Dendrothele bispora (strain CBS 962.96) TaxID=1314807 RepID=A0A4S8L3B7_DENBC|nr:hypothetical protein K435DRAFT_823206 [Dendrothele bispora CBS 962.96]
MPLLTTRDGKSSFYDIPLLVHKELSENPGLYPPFPVREHPTAIVVTPTKGLADSIIHEAEEFGLSGFSYCHDNITKYRNTDLVSSICSCTKWQLICVDPERLATPEWTTILRDKEFLKNLVLFCVEEAHLIRSWGPQFRPYFEFIGATARGFNPEGVSLVGLSATCAPVDPLRRKKGVSKYAKILEYLQSGRKAVIRVNTIPDCYDIYEFLWNHVPPGTSPLHRMQMYHSLCTDDYNRETFDLIDSDSKLQVVIATVAFTLGINRKSILDSISFGFPLKDGQVGHPMLFVEELRLYQRKILITLKQ